MHWFNLGCDGCNHLTKSKMKQKVNLNIANEVTMENPNKKKPIIIEWKYNNTRILLDPRSYYYL